MFQIGARWHRVVTAGLFRMGCCTWALWLVAGVTSAHARVCPEPTLQEVLPGIAVAHGLWASTGSGRAPHAVTTVVLVQDQQVTVVDPGPSRQAGEALKQSIRCRLQSQVAGLINTHAHAEQVLANSAFRVPVWATLGTAASMQARCPDCLAAMTEDLGSAALKGTHIVLPDRVLQEGQSLVMAGRQWEVRVMRQAHTESDLVLWAAAEGIALVGGLVDGDRLPVLAQGRVLGWLHALDEIQTWQPQWLIGQHLVSGPGHARVSLQRQRSYLCDLVRTAWQGMNAGLSEAEALQSLKLSPVWSAGEMSQQEARRQQHQFNQLRAWREIEPLWMARQPWPAQCGSAPDIGR